MNDKKKIWLLLGAVALILMALFIVLRPSVLTSGDDELAARRASPAPRAAPGLEMGTGSTPASDEPAAPAAPTRGDDE